MIIVGRRTLQFEFISELYFGVGLFVVIRKNLFYDRIGLVNDERGITLIESTYAGCKIISWHS